MYAKIPISIALLSLAALAVARTGAPQDRDPVALPPGLDMEMMAKMMELAQPGPEHEELARLAGEWEPAISAQMMPGAPPMKESAPATASMILGGRFLEIVSEGDFMGQPVESRAILGFDRRHEVFTLIALDTLGTYWVTAQGKRGEDGVIRMQGEDDEPMGKQVYTFEYEILSADEYEYRVLFSRLGSQEFEEPFEMVSVHCTRKKD